MFLLIHRKIDVFDTKAAHLCHDFVNPTQHWHLRHQSNLFSSPGGGPQRFASWLSHMIYLCYIYIYITFICGLYIWYMYIYIHKYMKIYIYNIRKYNIYISADPLSMKESSDVCSALLNPSHLSLRPSVCIWHSMPFPPARPPIH